MKITLTLIIAMLSFASFSKDLEIEITGKYTRSKEIWGTYSLHTSLLKSSGSKYYQRDKYTTSMIKSGRFFWVFPNEDTGVTKIEVHSSNIIKRRKKKRVRYITIRPQKVETLKKHYWHTIKRIVAHKLKIENVDFNKLELKNIICVNKWETMRCTQKLVYKNN